MKIYPASRGREVYRNIEICSDNTLNQLCQAILEAFDFIDENRIVSKINFRKRESRIIKSKGNIQQYPDMDEEISKYKSGGKQYA